MSHHNLYNKNGLMFWSEEEIRIRNMVVEHMVAVIRRSLLSMNQAFKLIQCEAPIMTPWAMVNRGYTEYFSDDPSDPELIFRPETTMGSYAYAKHILSGYHDPNYKLPICVWQHGKSFRQEQDQPTKFMRLKEFYQLEFQVLFSAKTANDYYPHIVMDVRNGLAELLSYVDGGKMGAVNIIPSDRLPDYSEQTTDVIFSDTLSKALEGMEICSISRRKDYSPDIKNVEVAIGTDRVVYNYMKRRKTVDEKED